MSEGIPRGKTAGELRAEYELLKALAEQDVRDLNSGRVRPAGSLRRMVRRLRWLAVGQVAIFLYALTTIGAIVTLGMDSRWECWALMPIPGLAIPILFHWGRLVAAESPNDQGQPPRLAGLAEPPCSRDSL